MDSLTHPTLHIYLLGDFRLVYDGTPLTTLDTPRLQSLLAYLVLHRQAPQPRQRLAFLLWPDSTEAQARTNLRNLFYQLRRALPEADRFVEADAKNLQWRAEAPFSLDVAAFENALLRAPQAGDQPTKRTILEEAISHYRGELLPSCYDEWLLAERDRLGQAFSDALEQLVRLLESERDYAAAIRYARQLLRHDPLNEAAYRRLMSLYALSGDQAAALRTYHTCVTILERDLAVEPGPVTQEIYQRLLKREALAASPVLSATSPLVGRQEAWAHLQAVWQTAVAPPGQPHLLLLTGEPGVGKTRLAEELLQWAGRQGMVTASAHCYAAEGDLAYAPITAWLRAQPLPRLEPLWLTEVARLLPEILLNRPDLPPPTPLTEAWQRQRLFEALARAILAGGGEHPLLLLLDDVQWCDRDTLEWLHYLLRVETPARLLIVGTLRPADIDTGQPLAALLPALRRYRRLTEIELGPLTEAETLALATQIAGQALDPALAAHLYRETEGNPLFIVEIVRASLDTALRQAQDTALRQAQDTAGALTQPPADQEAVFIAAALLPTVQAVIESRLAQLSPLARDLVNVAAVIGRAFTFSLLAQASRREEDDLARGLDELWRRRIAREHGLEAYDFSHHQIRQVVYAGLSAAQRRLLHRRVAEAFETVHAADLDAVSGQAAVHYERAGLLEEALSRYQRAAEAARQRYAHEAASNAYQSALALLPAEPGNAARRAALYEGLGWTLWLHGQPDAAVEAYTAMRAEAEQAGDPATQARAWNGLARSWVRRDNQAILENAIQAEAAARAAASQPELVRALFYQGWAQYRLKAVEAAVDMAEQALTLSRQLEMRPEMAQSWQLLGRIRAELMGDYAQAIDNHRRALALFEALGDQVMAADTLSNLGETYRFQGDYRTAASFYEEALALATGSGYRDGQMVFRSNLGGARVGLGDYRAAEADLSQVIAMPEAEQWLALAEAYGFLAEAYLGQGQGDKALHAARQALAVGQQRAQSEYIAAAWRVLGLIAAESPQPIVIGETAYDAPACLAESLRLFSDLRLEAERARTLRRWAAYALKQGDRSRGQAMWQEARETFARLGLDLEVERMDEGEG